MDGSKAGGQAVGLGTNGSESSRGGFTVDDVPFDRLIRAIALRFKQSEEAIENALSVFQNNWISSLRQWKDLTPDDRQAVIGVPVLLEQELHRLLELEAGENGARLFAKEVERMFRQADGTDLDGNAKQHKNGLSSKSKKKTKKTVEKKEGRNGFHHSPQVEEGVPQSGVDLDLALIEIDPPSVAHDESRDEAERQRGPEPTSIQNFMLRYPEVSVGDIYYVWMSDDLFQLETATSTLCEFRDNEHTVSDLLSSTFPSNPLVCLFDLNFQLISGSSRLKHVMKTPKLIWKGEPHEYSVILTKYQFKAIESWLREIKMEAKVLVFLKNYIDDFLVVPFIRMKDVEAMGINSSLEKGALIRSVTELQNESKSHFLSRWLRYLGFGKYEKTFLKHSIEVSYLNQLKETHLIKMGIEEKDRSKLFDIIKEYSEFSSVEATYAWLQDNGFERDSFQFVRFNIPFYALPLVNFFIINEMGISNYNELLQILEQLQNSPSYNIKAMSYWLRDIELEKYAPVFAKNLFVNFIESLTILSDRHIARLIDQKEDRDKMKRAVLDMREFHCYYTATSALVKDKTIDKYAKIFSLHNITMESLPLLKEEKLKQMGITDAFDLISIMKCVNKMREQTLLYFA